MKTFHSEQIRIDESFSSEKIRDIFRQIKERAYDSTQLEKIIKSGFESTELDKIDDSYITTYQNINQSAIKKVSRYINNSDYIIVTKKHSYVSAIITPYYIFGLFIPDSLKGNVKSHEWPKRWLYTKGSKNMVINELSTQDEIIVIERKDKRTFDKQNERRNSRLGMTENTAEYYAKCIAENKQKYRAMLNKLRTRRAADDIINKVAAAESLVSDAMKAITTAARKAIDADRDIRMTDLSSSVAVVTRRCSDIVYFLSSISADKSAEYNPDLNMTSYYTRELTNNIQMLDEEMNRLREMIKRL